MAFSKYMLENRESTFKIAIKKSGCCEKVISQ